MPRTSLELLALSQDASRWLSLEGLAPSDLPLWSGLPFPSPDTSLAFAVADGLNLSELAPSPEHMARAYRMHYDEDERSNWVFVPGSDGRVWIVSTRRVETSSN